MARPHTGLEQARREALTTILDTGASLPGKIPMTRPDAEHIFTIFAGSCGDVVKTARACGVEMQEVIELAESGGWLARISELIDLKKMGKFDDVTRALNRATNFVQVNRFRLYVERVLRLLTEANDEALLDNFTSKKVNKSGNVETTGFSLRVLADLASAMEKIHWMTYMSLCDGSPERAARKAEEKPEDAGSEADTHARIARTMAGMRMKTVAQVAEDAQAAAIEPTDSK